MTLLRLWLIGAFWFAVIVSPWLYIGTGIYVAVETPGFTPFVGFVTGTLVGIIGAWSFLAALEWEDESDSA